MQLHTQTPDAHTFALRRRSSAGCARAARCARRWPTRSTCTRWSRRSRPVLPPPPPLSDLRRLLSCPLSLFSKDCFTGLDKAVEEVKFRMSRYSVT